MSCIESEAASLAPRALHAAEHIDLWDGKCTADPTGEYWHEAKEVSLWELKD